MAVESSESLLQNAWNRLRRESRLANAAPQKDADVALVRTKIREAIEDVTRRCQVERARLSATETPRDLSDEAIWKMARFTHGLPLADFEGILHLVPRLVNIVTVRHPHTLPQ